MRKVVTGGSARSFVFFLEHECVKERTVGQVVPCNHASDGEVAARHTLVAAEQRSEPPSKRSLTTQLLPCRSRPHGTTTAARPRSVAGRAPTTSQRSTVSKLDPSEYEEEEERLLKEKKKESAIVKAKPTTINGWDPETQTQSILTDEQMQQGGGMGDGLGRLAVTALEARDVGQTFDASHGARTVMKQLLAAGVGTDNPHPPHQVEITYIGREREGGLIVDERRIPTVFNLDAEANRVDSRYPVLEPKGLVKCVRTMRLGEKARVTILPEQGYGAAGDEEGSSAEAFLEYEVELIRIVRVEKFENGGIIGRHLYPSDNLNQKNRVQMGNPKTRPPQKNAEVLIRWGGYLRGCKTR